MTSYAQIADYLGKKDDRPAPRGGAMLTVKRECTTPDLSASTLRPLGSNCIKPLSLPYMKTGQKP